MIQSFCAVDVPEVGVEAIQELHQVGEDHRCPEGVAVSSPPPEISMDGVRVAEDRDGLQAARFRVLALREDDSSGVEVASDR